MAEHLKEELSNVLTQISSDSSYERISQAQTILGSMRRENIYSLVGDIDLSPLFDRVGRAIGHEQEQKTEEYFNLLRKLLDSFPPVSLLMSYSGQLVEGLRTNIIPFKEIILQQLSRVSQDRSAVISLINNADLLKEIILVLGYKEPLLFKYSLTVLKHVAKNSEIVNLLLVPPVSNTIDSIINQGDVYKFRVFEVLVAIAMQSPTNLAILGASHYFKQLLDEVHKNNDILVKLNALELLTELASTEHGLTYLENEKVIADLQGMLQRSNEDPFASFTLPGLLKFFGALGYSNPQRLHTKNVQVLEIIFNQVEQSDLAIQIVALETIGIIARTAAGKRMLQFHENKMKQYFKVIAIVLQSGQTEFRLRALISLINVFHLEDQIANDLLVITETWYRHLSADPTKLLLSICKQPFSDIRCNAMGILREIAYQSWGQATLSNYPGFLEYLLDRSTETDKAGKESKYAIISAFVESDSAQNILSPEDLARLKEYHNQGPFFVAAETRVALEGAS